MNIKLTPEAKDAVVTALYKALATAQTEAKCFGSDREFWEKRVIAYMEAIEQITGNRPQLPP